ncbi:type IV pilus assembly protein PilY1 [Pseudomonas nitritireducens]|uniref:Type IV pilus assembly protein PilY1 n=1 Tax=Pseudomonas nitroreducens TaxID=46680 RepID=A0A7W7KQI3_PSENT|nr:PilC/PilY family type IV pilus protein [Pseudomonas nitritireducens]MBB4866608.1 type IV pilus assembly protein PilY1 [Pseudomonas nitritireducens]
MGVVALLLGLLGTASAAPISQLPLQHGGGAAGSLLLLPSTAHSAMAAAAHPGERYAPALAYVGYFDPDKCYGQEPAQLYFVPQGAALGHLCTGAWSGNFLNWATAQRLDVLRAALTGGDRYLDGGDGVTVLQKARNTRVDGQFTDRQVSAREVAGATPFSGSALYLRIAGQDRDLLFSRSPAFPGEPQEYRSGALLEASASYRLPVRVQVCVVGMLERNCRRHGPGFKPEGLLQRYAGRLRFSVVARSGGDGTAALQVEQRFIGPQRDDGSANPLAEWSAQGVLLANPDRDAGGSSGVIIYLNRFDEVGLRQADDPGESLYAAMRYLRHPGSSAAGTAAGDPISHACQRNSVLGFGSSGGAAVGEGLSRLAAPDRLLDLPQASRRVALLEGATAGGAALDFAGLAYDAHVGDLRPDLPGRQRLSLYWLPGETVASGSALWLATKYGGFSVPVGYRHGRDLPLPLAWWSDAGSPGPEHPANLLDSAAPERWHDQLQRVFVRAVEEGADGSVSLLAAGGPGELFSTRLDSARWSGDLLLWREGMAAAVWSAARRLDELSEAQLGKRNILTVRTPEPGQVARNGVSFAWSALDGAQRLALAADVGDGEQRLAYLRGSRQEERDSATSSRAYRQRDSRLGDIVHSRPAYSWHDPQPYAALPPPLGDAYREFLAGDAYRQRAPLVAVGANDGMLHGFDARDGRELFAYVPAAVFGHLRELAEPGYVHRFYVDGSPTFGNAWVAGRWRTLLVGTPGVGGRSVFALDVSDPQRLQPGSVLWEFSAPELGYSLGRPALLALASGRFVVALSSGARDLEGDEGFLWLLDAADGQALRRIRLPGAGDLGPVTAISSVGGVTADRLYLGDSRGQVWRVDLAGEDGSDSAIPASLGGGPLFQALDANGAAQAITAPLAVVDDTAGALRLLFGTGRYYRVGDDLAAPEKVDSLYGLVDNGQSIAGRSRLAPRRLAPTELGTSEDAGRGWYLDLPADGSRVIEQAQVRSGRFVLFNLITPGSDPCDDPLRHRAMLLDSSSGSEPDAARATTLAATGATLEQPSAVLLQPGEEGGVRWSTLDEQGAPRTQQLAVPNDSGRKAWQELR